MAFFPCSFFELKSALWRSLASVIGVLFMNKAFEVGVIYLSAMLCNQGTFFFLGNPVSANSNRRSRSYQSYIYRLSTWTFLKFCAIIPHLSILAVIIQHHEQKLCTHQKVHIKRLIVAGLWSYTSNAHLEPETPTWNTAGTTDFHMPVLHTPKADIKQHLGLRRYCLIWWKSPRGGVSRLSPWKHICVCTAYAMQGSKMHISWLIFFLRHRIFRNSRSEKYFGKHKS